MNAIKEVSTMFGVFGTILGLWAVAYMLVDSSTKQGVEIGQQQVREEAISFGAAHRGPKGQFIWGPVTKRELEVAR